MSKPILDKIELQLMRESDLDQVLAIEKACFSNPWSRLSFLLDLYSKDACCVVARLAGEVVGYAMGWFVLDELHINNIAVHHHVRRRGLGRKLLRFLLERAAERGSQRAVLELRVSNEAARRLYQTRGFYQTAIRKSYYRKPIEDAMVMSMNLALSPETGPADPEVRNGVVSKG